MTSSTFAINGDCSDGDNDVRTSPHGSSDGDSGSSEAAAAPTDDRSYPGTWLHFASLLAFGLLFYTGVIAISLATSQYVYSRYAAEVGITDAGRNTDSSKCKGTSNTTLDLKRRAAIAQERSANLSLYLTLVHSLPSLVSVFLLSAFSDRWGRKVSMLVPWCTTFLSFIIHVLVVVLTLPLEWLIVASVIAGLGGSFASMLAAMFASVADMTTTRNRAVSIGVAEAILTVCISVSELSVGVWIRTRGFKEPMLAFASIMTLSIVPFMCFMPETAPGCSSVSRRRQPPEPLTWQRLLALLSGTFRLFSSNWRRARQLAALIVAFFFLSMAFLSFGVNTLYLMGLPFCWNAEKLGYFIAASSVADQIVFVVVLGLLRSRVSDTFLTSIGLASSSSQNVVFGLAYLFQPPFDDIVLYLSRIAGLLSRLPATMLRTMISKSVSASEQGAAFGAVAFIQVFASLFAGTVTNAVYARTVANFTGFVFFLLAFWVLLSYLSVLFHSFMKRRDGSQTDAANESFEVNAGFSGPLDGDENATV